MKQTDIVKTVKNLPYLKKNNFSLLFSDIKESSFSQNIKNWLKRGILIKLKRGLYISSDYWENCKNKDDYLFYLSSLLSSPSYVSKEAVLSKYGLLSEAVFGVSAVSDSATRNYSSKVSNFSYSKIKESLFTGYVVKRFGFFEYNIATKAKALFDYLYFIKREMSQINQKTVSELRVNAEFMNKEDWNEFNKYLVISKSEKLRRIYRLLRGKNAA